MMPRRRPQKHRLRRGIRAKNAHELQEKIRGAIAHLDVPYNFARREAASNSVCAGEPITQCLRVVAGADDQQSLRFAGQQSIAVAVEIAMLACAVGLSIDLTADAAGLSRISVSPGPLSQEDWKVSDAGALLFAQLPG